MPPFLPSTGRARRSLLGLVVAVLASAAPTSAQTLPLPPGAGFEWETVGDRDDVGPDYLWFDAGGTLWVPNRPPMWLDLRGGWPGIWQEPNPPNPQPSGYAMMTLGSHPLGGLPRADTVLVTGGRINRSTDGGWTWDGWQASLTNYALYEIPRGLPHGGRLLAGNLPALSDDRGATWTDSLFSTDDIPVSVEAFIALPDAARLPGAASGRDPAMPAGWPVGRVVAAGYNTVAILSDDGGRTWRPTANGYNFGLLGEAVTLVRRPDTHPLGPGPRLLVVLSGDVPASSVWSSDDAGQTWVRRANLPEPGDGPGWPSPTTVLALPEPGESDAGAGGCALVVLKRGHLYQTTDGGETWGVVGRVPGIRSSDDPEGFTVAAAATLGPDGRLYVAPNRGWVWRTAEPFVVAADDAPPAPASTLRVAVYPNPVEGAATVRLTGAAGPARFRVVDPLGRVVARAERPSADGWTVATDGWAPGVYTVVAEADGATARTRLIVVR